MRWLQARRAWCVRLGLLIASVLSLYPAAGEDLYFGFGKRPEYPLYSPYFGRPHPFSAGDVERLARNFDLIFGVRPDKETIDRVHRLNPQFRFIQHAGPSTVRAGLAEKQLRRQLLYYPCATLAGAINAKASTFRLGHRADAGRVSLKASTVAGAESRGSRQYVTWIRVDDELMRIESFNAESGEISVTRNFDGGNLQEHALNAGVFCPAYGVAPGGAPEWEPALGLTYHYDPAYPARWAHLFEELGEAVENGADGLWIDLVMDRGWREVDINGSELRSSEESQSPCWNFAAGRFYLKDELRKKNEEGVRVLQERFRAKYGRYPLLYGYGLAASRFEEGGGGHKYLLLPTEAKPRPLDGMGIEEFMGGYNMEEWLLWTRARKVSPPRKALYPSTAPFRNWAENIRLLMRCAQSNLAAMPFTINANPRAAIFQELDRKSRHDWELWAYCGYLLGVEKHDGKCSTPLGITMFSQEDHQRSVKLDPMYYWRIGEPLETLKPEDFEKYRVPGTEVFRRRFSHGLVLVNPATQRQELKLDREYYHPEAGQRVHEVALEEQSGMILLDKPPR